MFLPSSVKTAVEPELQALGDKVLSTEIFDSISDAERNLPHLRGSGRDAFGQPRSDSLVVTEGWTNLQKFGIQNGFEHPSYEVSLMIAGLQTDLRAEWLRTTMTKVSLSTPA